LLRSARKRSPTAPRLPAAGVVHLWRVDLGVPPRQLERLRATLSPDELVRAVRYRAERDRRRFVAGRGALRDILARYTDVDPVRLRFRYGRAGKPELDGDVVAVRFNVSHCDDLALVAVTGRYSVGVDVERVRELPDLEGMAAIVLSERERSVLGGLAGARRVRAFFECWTRKEAFVKAVGDGLRMPVERIEVSLAPGAPPRLLRVAGDRRSAQRWTLRALAPGHGYVGALAVEGHGVRVSLRRWIG
jgi:4'-phosphopantetheinyl transferase